MAVEPGRGDPAPVHNDFSGQAHNVVQAEHIGAVYLPRPVDTGRIVVGPVPRKPQHFQRRDQIDQLAELAESGEAAVVCAVTGQRGVGKTQLVGSYARQRIHDEWLIAWIPGETADAVARGLSELADALNLRREGDDDADVLARVRNLLQTRREPALLVFDNVTDPEHVTPHLPAGGSTQIVITSAAHAVERLGKRVPVDLFTADTALRFLFNTTGLEDEEGARTLAAKLGYLPLALAQAAARIARPPRGDYGKYLQLLENVSLDQALTARSGDPYPLGAAEAILLAVEPFLEAPERDVLDLLSVLSPDGVSRALLDADDNLLDRLYEASLIEFAGGDADTVVVMHRLTQRVLRERANHNLLPVLAHAGRLVEEATFSEREAWQRRDEGDELIRHIETLWEHAQLDGDSEVIGRVLFLRRWAVHQLISSTAAHRAVHFAEDAHADHVRVYNDDDPELGGAHHCLAVAYRRVGRLDDAIPLYKQALGNARRTLGDENPSTLGMACNLGSTYRDAGKLDDAIALLERTVPQARRVLGDDEMVTRNAQGHLAYVYQQAGRIGDAIQLFERVFSAAQRILGDGDLATLDAADSLACAYEAALDANKAIQVLEPILATCRQHYGDLHPAVLHATSNLAGMYGAGGRLEEAIPLYEQILGDQRQTFGEDYLEAFFTAINLANNYCAAGRMDDAIRLAEHTRARRRQVLGDHHPDTLDAATILVQIYGDAGRLDEAIQLGEQTLADQRQVLSAGHHSVVELTSILTWLYGRTERWDKAISVYERIVNDSRRAHGRDHEITRGLTVGLAGICRSAGRPDLETPLRQQILVATSRILGHTHPDSVTAAVHLAGAYLADGKSGLAIPHLEFAYDQSVEQRGDRDPMTRKIGNNLAVAYDNTDRFDEAMAFYRRTGIIARRAMLTEHPVNPAGPNFFRPGTDK